MKSRRTQTGQLLVDLRDATGLSPEDVPHAMIKAKIGRDYIPTGRVIRRAEDQGSLPIQRYRFGLAQFYGVDYHELWGRDPKRRRRTRATHGMTAVPA